MPLDPARRRALIARRATEDGALRGLFADGALSGWEAVPADSFERARFVMQHAPCDVLVVDEGLACADGDGIAWVVRQREVPVVCLAGSEAETFTRAFERGALVCLPRQLTLSHPPLLAAALRQAARLADNRRCQRRTQAGLIQSRQQIDRLVSLLWRSVPMDPDRRWYTQRHMLERLEEELARARRHGGDLTVALGEVEMQRRGNGVVEATDWVPDRVCRMKRRCDIAGQYGPRAFMLLMVNTAKDGGVACCRRLRRALETAERAGGSVRIAFGLESFSAGAATSGTLLARAEGHLDAARAVGEGIVAG